MMGRHLCDAAAPGAVGAVLSPRGPTELCRRLAALGAGGAADPQPKQGELELSRDQAGWLRVAHGG